MSKFAIDKNISDIVCALGGYERFKRGKWIIIYIAFIKDQIIFKEALSIKLIRKCTATIAFEAEEAFFDLSASPLKKELEGD